MQVRRYNISDRAPAGGQLVELGQSRRDFLLNDFGGIFREYAQSHLITPTGIYSESICLWRGDYGDL